MTLLSLLMSAMLAGGDSITVVFAGDVMQHKPQMSAAFENGRYNYEPCFRQIREEIGSADLAIANLEVPLGGMPYSGYPRFSGPDALAATLKDIGFDVLLTANNHALDRETGGALRTIHVLDSLGIRHTGMFPDSAERSRNYPLQITSGNMHFSILNYTYDTNGLPWKKPFIINIIDSALILRDIATAKTTNPDVIIAFMHWGTEYERQPNREQKLLAELMRREGVHLVIGAHPHVIQPMEKHVATDGRCRQLTAWSLGNLVSNQPFENSDGGALLKVALKKDSAGVWVSWAGYSLVWVYKPVERGLPRHYILPVTQFEADTARLLPQYRRQIRTFAKNSRQLLNTYNKGISEYRFFQNIPVKRIEPIPPVPLVSTVNKKQLKQK